MAELRAQRAADAAMERQAQMDAYINTLTITEAYDDTEAFRALLLRLNLPESNVSRLIDEEGFDTARVFSFTRVKDIETSIENVNKLFGARTGAARIYFAPIRVARLRALCVYLKRCNTINQIPDIRLIDLVRCQGFMESYPAWVEKDNDTDDVVKQREIKFDPVNFQPFKDSFMTLLASVKGARGITLEYVARKGNNDNQVPEEVEMPDVDSAENIKNNATLFGNEYKRDNTKVFTLLRTILTNTVAWDIISTKAKNQDGRGAFMALLNHYEGDSFNDLKRTEATAKMTKTFYSGDTRTFTWEKFVSVHLKAHRLYSETGEPLTENMKILNFKTGIRSSAGLEGTIETARANPNVNLTFDSYVNFLTEGVMNKRSRERLHKQTAVPRQVSDYETSSSGTNHSGRGRGRGRGGRGGRGGRFGGRGGRFNGGRGGGRFGSQGRGNQNNEGYYVFVDGKKLYPNKTYTADEYSNLTYNQKGALRRARRNRSLDNNNNDDNSTLTTRNVRSAISEAFKEAMSSGEKQAESDNNKEGSGKDGSESVLEQFRKRRRTE